MKVNPTEKIYILKNNKLFLGPYSLQKLKERRLKANDLVWFEGLPDWTHAERIDGLKEVIITPPLGSNDRKSMMRRIIFRLLGR